MPIRHRIAPLTAPGCPGMVLRGISRNFFRLFPCDGQVAYVLLTRAPVAGRSKQAYFPAAPRLACVKPVASVHPEPGSNSPLFYLVFFSFQIRRQDNHLLFCSVCRTTFREMPWRMTDCIVLGRNLTETHILGGVAASYPCLILYYFVSLLKSLNVLFFRFRKRFARQSY